VVRFGDKGQFQYGYTTSATDENTGTKFLRITDIKEEGIINWGTVPYGSIDDNNLQKFRLSKGDILFARIGATTGKRCIIGGAIPNVVFASYLIRFVPDKELHPKYVFYFTQTRAYQELVNAGKEEKLKKGLSATESKNFRIPLPPILEQRAIANVLSTVQQAKEKTDAVIFATKELKKSMMKHLFTYGPVQVKKFNEFGEFNELRVNELQNAQNSSNSKNSIKLKETGIGLVPEEWEVKKIGSFAKFQGGYAFKSTDYQSEGVPLFFV
jgi:type I restriction enzyme S subunit